MVDSFASVATLVTLDVEVILLSSHQLNIWEFFNDGIPGLTERLEVMAHVSVELFELFVVVPLIPRQPSFSFRLQRTDVNIFIGSFFLFEIGGLFFGHFDFVGPD